MHGYGLVSLGYCHLLDFRTRCWTVAEDNYIWTIFYCYVNYQFPGTFTCLEVVFRFKRRLGYYLFHTYVPTCLIVIMSWISFWIKPEAVPARVTLGVTSLLTLSTQHANSQKSLPPVSYIKVLLEYFFFKHS